MIIKRKDGPRLALTDWSGLFVLKREAAALSYKRLFDPGDGDYVQLWAVFGRSRMMKQNPCPRLALTDPIGLVVRIRQGASQSYDIILSP